MYGDFDHANTEDFYEACGIDKEIVKKLYEKIMTDIKEKDLMSEVVELLEDAIFDERTAESMPRPLAIIVVKMMMEEIKREHLMDAVTGALSKFGEKVQKGAKNLDLSREDLENYIQKVVDLHKKP